jgi:hypothetical protein
MNRENRQFSRTVLNWPVTINTSEDTFKGETRDISPDGAFIYCDRPLPANHLFCLSIHIYSETISLTSMAETVWSTHNGMGVRFHLDRPQQGELLARFISDV